MPNIKDLTTKVKTVISKNAMDQIRYLCKNISTIEWSGALFYSLDGSVTDPKNLTITLEAILPLDRGTSGFTSYEIGSEVVDYMEANETFDKGWYMGHIHSHHNMSVYFSGTDTSELEDNTPNHNFYLSVIVNNKMEIVGKLAIPAKSNVGEVTDKDLGFVALDEDGEEYFMEEVAKKEEVKLYAYDCEIVKPYDDIVVSEEFEELYKAMKSHRPTYNRDSYSSSNYKPGIGFRNYWDDEDDDVSYEKPKNRGQIEYLTPAQKNAKLIDGIAMDLLMIKDPQAGKFKNLEEVLDYLVVMDADGSALALDAKKGYDEVVEEYYTNPNSVPHHYILKSLIELFGGEMVKAKKDVYNILEPVVATLKAKQLLMLKVKED